MLASMETTHKNKKQTHDLTLFEFQQEVFKDDTRYKIVSAGRRTGKSHLSCVMALSHVTAKPGNRCIMVSPTFGMAKAALWDTLKLLCHPDWLDGPPREGDLEMRFINGGRITLKGADRPDSLRGISPTPGLIVLDEMAYFKPGVFQEVILPMTSDALQKPRLMIISTPKGKANTFYDLWSRGQDHDYPDWKSWQFAAVDVRPDMANEIVLARNSLDQRTFDQEYAASFLNTGDNVFTEFNRDVHIIDVMPFQPGESVHVAVDFNVAKMCATAFAVRGDQMQCIQDFEGSANTDELCKKLKAEYPGRNIICYPDPSGNARKTSSAVGVTDFSIMRGHGFELRYRNKHPSIVDSVNAVNRLLRDANGNVRLFFAKKGCDGTIHSMEATSWKPIANSNDMDTATIDKTAGVEHFSDGMRYACEYLMPVTSRGAAIIKGTMF